MPHVSVIIIFVAIIIIVGAVGWYLATKFKQQAMHGGREDVSHSLLTEIRNAYREGEISEEEYQQIRARLAASIRESTDFPTIMTVEAGEFVEYEADSESDSERETASREMLAEQQK